MATEGFVRHLDLGPLSPNHSEPVEVLVPQKDVGEEAVVVWDSALVLSYFLVKHRQEFLSPNTRVLELGAGTGAVGLVTAALGAGKVTVTDLPRVIPLLEEAIALNSNLKNIEAKALTWGEWTEENSFEEKEEKNETCYDLILVSDCIYYEACVEPLIQTLTKFCKLNKNCRVLLSYEVRDYSEVKKKISKEFFRAVGEYFKILPFKTGECHEEYASDDIRVIQLLPKPTTDHAN